MAQLPEHIEERERALNERFSELDELLKSCLEMAKSKPQDSNQSAAAHTGQKRVADATNDTQQPQAKRQRVQTPSSSSTAATRKPTATKTFQKAIPTPPSTRHDRPIGQAPSSPPGLRLNDSGASAVTPSPSTDKPRRRHPSNNLQSRRDVLEDDLRPQKRDRRAHEDPARIEQATLNKGTITTSSFHP